MAQESTYANNPHQDNDTTKLSFSFHSRNSGRESQPQDHGNVTPVNDEANAATHGHLSILLVTYVVCPFGTRVGSGDVLPFLSESRPVTA